MAYPSWWICRIPGGNDYYLSLQQVPAPTEVCFDHWQKTHWKRRPCRCRGGRSRCRKATSTPASALSGASGTSPRWNCPSACCPANLDVARRLPARTARVIRARVTLRYVGRGDPDMARAAQIPVFQGLRKEKSGGGGPRFVANSNKR